MLLVGGVLRGQGVRGRGERGKLQPHIPSRQTGADDPDQGVGRMETYTARWMVAAVMYHFGVCIRPTPCCDRAAIFEKKSLLFVKRSFVVGSERVLLVIVRVLLSLSRCTVI